MFTLFEQFNNIKTFVSTSEQGQSTGAYSSNNLALHTGDDEKNVIANRAHLCKNLEIDSNKLLIPNQTHSSNIAIVTNNTTTIENTDALITNEKGLCIAVLTADCVPLIIYNAKQQVAGVIHAGWKGIVNEIIPITIDKMMTQFGGKAETFYVGIGPCISKKNYEVGEDVASLFDNLFAKSMRIVDRTQEKPHIDLVMAARVQLVSCGIPQLQIESSGECTFQNNLYFSARRQGIKSGRFASGICLTQ